MNNVNVVYCKCPDRGIAGNENENESHVVN